jgi:hypothetical protein
MVIASTMLIDGGGGVLDLTPTSITASQPSPPLSAYYNTYGLDQDEINNQINLWYDANNDKLIISISGATQALSFKYRIVQQSENFSSVNDTLTTNRTFTLSGLIPGQTYKIKIQGYQFSNGTGEFGNSLVKENIFISKFERLAKITSTSEEYIDNIFWQEKNSQNTTVESQNTTLDSEYIDNIFWQEKNYQNEQVETEYIDDIFRNSYSSLPVKNSNKSLASLTNIDKDPNRYAIAYKTFHEIPPVRSGVLYYSFGTTLILDGSLESPGESGGFGFFVNNFGSTGYFLQVDSTKRSADINSKRRVRLFKVLSGDKRFVADSQIIPETTIDLIQPGTPYKIDIKVKHTGSLAEIEIYVNGFKIFIEDTSPLTPTSQVAMFSSIGTIFFDYIYGFEIQETNFNDGTLYSAYSGQFSKNSLEFILGNKIFNKNDRVQGSWPQTGRLEDFGKIAREIKKIEVAFSNAPSFPIEPSTGINEFAYVIGHKTDNFKSEIYVVNNSGFFTPLSDGNVSLVIYGYNIYKSGSLEYKDEESNEFTKDEPVYFESEWIQNEENVKSLATWLKTQWAKGYTVVDIRVFGGILISVGDIVTINYSYHGLTTSKKFLVQSVNHFYSDGGLETTLTCRSL